MSVNSGLFAFLCRFWRRRRNARDRNGTPVQRRKRMSRHPLSIHRELKGRGKHSVNHSYTLLFSPRTEAHSLAFPLLLLLASVIICRVSCRGRRGSQGSEPYSPYDFSEEQDVPESKHPWPDILLNCFLNVYASVMMIQKNIMIQLRSHSAAFKCSLLIVLLK